MVIVICKNLKTELVSLCMKRAIGMKKTLIAIVAVVTVSLLLAGALYSVIHQPNYTEQITSMMNEKWEEYA